MRLSLCFSGPVLPPKKLNTALDGYSNLIDLSTPPDSPFRAKGTSADAKPTFHYPSPGEEPTSFSPSSFHFVRRDLTDSLYRVVVGLTPCSNLLFEFHQGSPNSPLSFLRTYWST